MRLTTQEWEVPTPQFNWPAHGRSALGTWWPRLHLLEARTLLRTLFCITTQATATAQITRSTTVQSTAVQIAYVQIALDHSTTAPSTGMSVGTSAGIGRTQLSGWCPARLWVRCLFHCGCGCTACWPVRRAEDQSRCVLYGEGRNRPTPWTFDSFLLEGCLFNLAVRLVG